MAASLLDVDSLVEFENVAAGHEGVLVDPSGDLIIKPCTQAEILFYEQTVSGHEAFAALIPTFMGTLQLGRTKQLEETVKKAQEQDAGSSIVLPTEVGAINGTGTAHPDLLSTRGKPLDTELSIVLENVAAGFRRPNILDIKLGKRLWADDAPDAKRTKFDKVASETTSGSLGFRIAGMKTWQKDAYRIYDKWYGRGRTSDNIQEAFEDFFDAASQGGDLESFCDIIQGVIEAVEEIEDTIAHQESRMYSSSLLFVYEGDRTARKEAFNSVYATSKAQDSVASLPDGDACEDQEEDEDVVEQAPDKKIFDVRVIDFAHAKWVDGLGPDENMLCGIRNVIRILKHMA